jgi:hypothetical protein
MCAKPEHAMHPEQMDFGPELVHEMELMQEMQDARDLAALPMVALDRGLLAAALDGLSSTDLAALRLATPAGRRRHADRRSAATAMYCASKIGRTV